MGQISPSTESTGRRQPAAGRKWGRCCMTVHEGLCYFNGWVAVVVGRRLGLQGAAGGKGKVGKGNANSQTQQPLSIHLLDNSLGKRFSDPTRFSYKKVLSIKDLYRKPGLFWSTELLLPKKGAIKQQSRVVCCESLGGLAVIKSDHPSSRRVAHVSEVLDSPKTKAPCSWKVP